MRASDVRLIFIKFLLPASFQTSLFILIEICVLLRSASFLTTGVDGEDLSTSSFTSTFALVFALRTGSKLLKAISKTISINSLVLNRGCLCANIPLTVFIISKNFSSAPNFISEILAVTCRIVSLTGAGSTLDFSKRILSPSRALLFLKLSITSSLSSTLKGAPAFSSKRK